MSLWSSLTCRRGNLAGDGALYGSLALALLGLALLSFGSEWASGLVGFVIVTIWVNGPIGIFLPATYEPILMLFGGLYSPLLIAALGTLGILYIEGLNYFLYQRLVRTSLMAPMRQSAIIRWLTGHFASSPFLTTWVCAWSPLPYWAVRFLAPLSGYPLRRYLTATALGRLPRLYFFAWLGPALHLSTQILATVAGASILLFFVTFFARRSSGMATASPPGS